MPRLIPVFSLALLALPLAASKVPLNELLVQLDNRRTSVVEALRQTAQTCPMDSPKLKEAQKRYREAREASNGFVNQLILDLGQDDLQREKVYRAKLETAQRSTDDLLVFLDSADCSGQAQAKVVPLAIISLVGKLPDFFGWIGNFFARHHAEAKERRQTLIHSLEGMRWSGFDEVVKDTAPARSESPEVALPPAEALTVQLSAPPVTALPVTPGLTVAVPVTPTLEAVEPELAAPPVLRLETGQHTAAIRSLSVSRDGRLALTASEDRTARVWDLASGQLLRIIRPFVGDGNTGKLYAGALSPDGRLAALGGWTSTPPDKAHRLLLVDVQSGELLRIIEVGPQVVNYLAFSPDGQRLAMHLGGNLGVRMLKTSNGALLGQDTDFAQPSYRGAFDAQGHYAATGDDGYVRLYDTGGKRLLKVKAPAEAPFGLAFSPDGQQLALAYAESGRVDVLRASDLSMLRSLTPSAHPLGLVAWSPDGRTLYASGGEDFGPAPTVLRRWTEAGAGTASEAPLCRATVSDLLPLADGTLAFASQDPAWDVLGQDGQPHFRNAIQQTDLREARQAFRMGADGTHITLPGRIPDASKLVFSARDLDLVPGEELPAPRVSPDVTGWQDSLHPAFKGSPLVLEDFETARSLAAAPDGSFLLGTDWYLRAYDAKGAPRWKMLLPAPAWGLALAQEGHVTAAMLADGSFRWFRTSDGAPLASLFVTPDRRWIAWTPSGRFASSVGGEALAGWQVNRKDQAADFFPMSRFRDRFWMPELFPVLFSTLDEASALQTLQGGTAAVVSQLPFAAELPSVLRILSPREGENVPPGTLMQAQVGLRTYGGVSPIKGFQIFLNGSRMPPSRGLRPKQASRLSDGVETIYTIPVTQPAHAVTLGIRAEMEDGRLSELAEVRLRVTVPLPVETPIPAGSAPIPTTPAMPLPAPVPAAAVLALPVAPPLPEPVPPTLRLLSVGISSFANAKLNLKFSAKDATDIAEFFKGQEGRLFQKVETRLLTDAQATTAAITAAMENLARTSTPTSVTLYFFSSHGGTNAQKSDYFFVTHDYGQGSWGLDGPAMKSLLDRTQGKAVLLMDTCHSGNVLGEGQMRSLGQNVQRTRFINELVDSGPGMQVFSSSSGIQYSLESPAWNNGAFTKALREGLAGAADTQRSGRVTTEMLDAWLRKRVAELTNGRQTPVAARSPHADPFPIALE